MDPSPLSHEDDEPHEKCGVFAVYGPELDVSRLAFFGLVALQHRGQESCGIATYPNVLITIISHHSHHHSYHISPHIIFI